MRWFGSPGTRAQPPPPPAEPTAPVHVSLALPALVRQLHVLDKDKLHVLDLGPGLGSNVDFFSRLPCRLYIEDLYRSLKGRPLPTGSDGRFPRNLLRNLLHHPPEARFDIILAWDLLNYLERDEIRELGAYLARFCHPRTCMVAWIWILAEMPAEPIRFRILDEGHLQYDFSSPARIRAPRYRPRELGKLLPDFAVEATYLMRHGVQEYLFIPRPRQEETEADPAPA